MREMTSSICALSSRTSTVAEVRTGLSAYAIPLAAVAAKAKANNWRVMVAPPRAVGSARSCRHLQHHLLRDVELGADGVGDDRVTSGARTLDGDGDRVVTAVELALETEGALGHLLAAGDEAQPIGERDLEGDV